MPVQTTSKLRRKVPKSIPSIASIPSSDVTRSRPTKQPGAMHQMKSTPLPLYSAPGSTRQLATFCEQERARAILNAKSASIKSNFEWPNEPVPQWTLSVVLVALSAFLARLWEVLTHYSRNHTSPSAVATPSVPRSQRNTRTTKLEMNRSLQSLEPIACTGDDPEGLAQNVRSFASETPRAVPQQAPRRWMLHSNFALLCLLRFWIHWKWSSRTWWTINALSINLNIAETSVTTSSSFWYIFS